ncbi:hypothetical protein [Burkholderia pseudomallei]|uniref:hypothetical protein n=1 Tax=Burkholderia pseudomallei TaxID=28450 RepID=UPI000A19FE35|nr:hypothetical protein [Burkholderia pseudomallei]ARK48421.1 hypothetical protein BOC35_19215 [Burkholderia pseudomallei]ARL16807.1 hypothetical protein BOC46_15685 [Burkholderia pseudomallei]RPE17399.1 hypothetical protein DF127_18605 [Burkholderia pseudomallei]RPE21164.1 hypothetical protein DF068_17335 [Burkholderia pseudomallei]RQS92030.1 hypothetical protein DF125_16520 [Burkholderia pseudomallei]
MGDDCPLRLRLRLRLRLPRGRDGCRSRRVAMVKSRSVAGRRPRRLLSQGERAAAIGDGMCRLPTDTHSANLNPAEPLNR